MIKRAALATAFLVPLVALAVDISPADFYDDVRSTSPEAAGINLLTRAGVVQGYGNRLYGPARLVNRAEFLKIALLSTPEDRRPALTANDGCFPDVPAGEWFTLYVCSAKQAGIVQGNPDGLFHPERTVQYDEALKMLTLLFGYQIGSSDSADWGEKYYDAAAARGTDLPVRITFGTQLTRAQTARVAAAFVAEFAGQLEEFRLAESGEYMASSSQESESSSSASSESSSSMTSSSSSAAPAALFTLPPAPHFLVTGETSDAIASGKVHPSGEAAQISLVQVKLFSEVRSIEKLEIVTTEGQVLATLLRKITTDTTDYKLTFDGTVNPENRITLPADTDTTLVLRAVVRGLDNAGFSNELLQVRTFNVTLVGVTSNQAVNIPMDGPFPKHQTAFGRVTAVRALSPQSATPSSGTGVLFGSFSFSGSLHSTKAMALSELTFSLQKTGMVSFGGFKVRNNTTATEAACTLNQQAMTVYCPNLQNDTGVFPRSTPLVLDLYGNVTIENGATDVSYEADLTTAGSPEELGSVQWTDSSGTFRWIETPFSPIARGIRFQ